MNTTQLRCFLSVAEYLSFARAAEQLNMTQPAISHQISSLEKELDVQLFVRTTRSVTLTEEGSIFINDAKNIVKIAYGAKNRIQNHSLNHVRLFNIGFHSAMEMTLFPEVLKNVSYQFPSVRPNLKMLPAKSLRNLLETEDIDVMLSFRMEPGIKEPGIYIELCKCSLACIMPREHALSQSPDLSPADLHAEDLILYETHKNPPVLAQLQNRFVELHPPEKRTYTDTAECALTLVRAGLGITVIPDFLPVHALDLAYVPLKDFEPISYGLYYKSTKNKAVLKQFIKELKIVFQTAM